VAEVYVIRFPNAKLYVGIAKRSAAARLKQHVRDAKQGSTYAVHNAIRKYSPDSVRLVLLAQGVTWAEAKRLEIHWIAKLGTMAPDGYNLTAGGDGVVDPSGAMGRKISEATRRQWADAEKRKVLLAAVTANAAKGTAATQRLWADPEKRKVLLAAARDSIAKAHNAVRRKYKTDPEFRRKMQATRQRMWVDPEKRKVLLAAAMANAAKGADAIRTNWQPGHVIHLLKRPKKKGTSALRARHYSDGMTCAEYIDACVADPELLARWDVTYLRKKARTDLTWDAERGYIRLYAACSSNNARYICSKAAHSARSASSDGL